MCLIIPASQVRVVCLISWHRTDGAAGRLPEALCGQWEMGNIDVSNTQIVTAHCNPHRSLILADQQSALCDIWASTTLTSTSGDCTNACNGPVVTCSSDAVTALVLPAGVEGMDVYCAENVLLIL